MQPNKKQLKEYDFFCTHKHTIERLRKEVDGLLVYFKKHRIIKSFTAKVETIIPNLKLVKFATTLDTGSKYLPTLPCTIMVYMEHPPKDQSLVKMQLKKGQKSIRLVLPHHFSYETYRDRLYNEISFQSFGIECEIEFLEKFLYPLKQHHQEILYVQHTSTKKDMDVLSKNTRVSTLILASMFFNQSILETKESLSVTSLRFLQNS